MTQISSNFMFSTEEYPLEEPVLISGTWIKEELQKFLSNNKLSTIIFPKSLNSYHRKLVHDYSEELQFISKSIGEKHNRCIFVHKKSVSNEEIQRRHKKNWHEIPIGLSCIFETLDISLWLGSGVDVRRENSLREHGITHIVNCSQKWENYTFPNIEYNTCFLPDKTSEDDYYDIEKLLKNTCQFIEKARAVSINNFYALSSTRVLFHCYDGRTKSVIVLLAYLISYQDFSLISAYNLVKSRRLNISPPTHLMKQLCNFEAMVRGGKPTMTQKDWMHDIVKNDTISPPILKKGLSKADKEEIALQWLTLEKLLKEAEGIIFKPENVQTFIKTVLLDLQDDIIIKQEMSEKGFEWNEISDTLAERAKDWFLDKNIKFEQDMKSDNDDSGSDSYDSLFV